jgi:hypothetical protein
MTIDNSDLMTITDLQIIHILLAPGQIADVDILIHRLGNEDVTNR